VIERRSLRRRPGHDGGLVADASARRHRADLEPVLPTTTAGAAA
jgi:hypothetical protein